MFGKIQLENFNGITQMPQDVASAWHDAFDGLVGVSYKPLVYLGKQIVHGVNYYFVAEQTFMTNPIYRRVVCLAINANDNDVHLIDESIREIL